MLEEHRQKTDEQQDKDIEKLYDHARVANEEMGGIQISVGVIQNDIQWVKIMLEKVDNRTWYILTAIILATLINIAVILFKR